MSRLRAAAGAVVEALEPRAMMSASPLRIGEVPAGSPAGSEALKLVPKTPQPDYDWLLLVVDRQSLALHGLVTGDAQGGKSSITFANLKENVNPADKEFAFNIPRGVDVINDSSR